MYVLYAVACLVLTLCYKPEGCRFETQWGNLILSIYQILLATLGTGVYSASNRNDYLRQKLILRSRAWPVHKFDSLMAICEPVA
jgi:hypothetical protein